MALDNTTRLQYLEAMGVDVWIPIASAPVGQTLTLHSQAVDELPLALPPITPPVIAETDSRTTPLSQSASDETWLTLESQVSACTKCSLCETRTQTVFGTGCKTADWMLIGEAPGQHEDEQGQPFVGKAGLLLTEMLRAIGLQRDDVYIANILKCRPPGNRDPKPDEIALCSDYLRQQQALVKPKIILAVGRIAAQALLQTDAPLSKLRGKVHQLGDIPLVVVYHPSYLLRSLLEKRKAWQDLQFAVKTINRNRG
jgi:uracil-DNA glycosylase